jgi:hypothetical protein
MTQPQFTPPPTYKPTYVAATPPTAWQSLPSAVRFAVWVWTVCMIASVVGAAIFAVLWMLFMASLTGGSQ